MAAILMMDAASASDGAAASPRAAVAGYEAWAGADATATGWSVYGGLTAALFGDVRDSGWRVRTAASYGAYRYRRSYWDAAAHKEYKQLPFVSERYVLDAELGYQHSTGPVTAKLFAGLTDEHQRDVTRAVTPVLLDDDSPFQGGRRGLKLALETWTRLADWGFVQADVSWSSPRDAYGGRARLGYRLDANWSTGLEISASGNGFPDQGRAGGFVRLEWSAGEISVSAGTVGDDRDALGAYGTLNALLRF